MKRFVFIISALLITNTLFSQDKQVYDNIRIITQGKKATVGVSVIFDGKDTLSVNADYRFPTMSVYKFHQALAVLDHLHKNSLSLDTRIHVEKSDLLPDTYSPLRDKNPQGDFDLTVGELLKYSVSLSDNNACDILFKYLGGTEVVDQYIKGIGIADVSISATEAEMHETPENQYLNWTTPMAAVTLLETFMNKDLFPASYKRSLEDLMIGSNTGVDKMKFLLPENVVVGHKTGSSSRTEMGIKVAENDMGFVRLPNGKQYTIAIFVMNSMEDDKTTNSIIASISRIVYDYYKSK